MRAARAFGNRHFGAFVATPGVIFLGAPIFFVLSVLTATLFLAHPLAGMVFPLGVGSGWPVS